MNAEQARDLLKRLARRWHKQVLLQAALEAGAGAIVALAVLHAIFGVPAAVLGLGLYAGLFGLLLGLRRRRFGDLRTVARHLDRVLPQLQDSCELVLEPAEPGAILDRLQRQRLFEALEGVPEERLLPTQARTDAWKRFAAGSAVALLVTLLAQGTVLPTQPVPAVPVQPPASGAVPAVASVDLESVAVEIEPPEYTGRPRQQATGLDFSAAEGSRLRWQVSLGGEAGSLSLVFGDEDRLPMAPAGPRAYAAETQAWASKVYFLEGERAGRIVLRSDYGRLSVIRDQPPRLRVIEPPPRTELDPNQLAPLQVQVLAQDDYALTQAELIMTLTSGAGESVQFREQRRPLQIPGAPGPARLETTLDLAGLGMGPGDELYFHIEALDNRQPEQNRARSETCFVRVRRLSEPPRSGTEGIVINPVPEYFRSQRQIIIDTEKLLAEQPQLQKSEFERRSNELGLDQRLLRLRHGTLLGEEFESGRVVSEAAAHAEQVGEAPEGGDEHAGHEEAPPAMGQPELGPMSGALAGVPEALVHQHDSAETATYFQNEVRATLKGALAQMWQAELYLRTNRPQEALPYEYEALRLLKSLQEASRVYVERVGFDPPPLKPDEARLTGDLAKVAPGTSEHERHKATELPEVREGLRALLSLQGGEAMSTEEAAAALQQAGQELARRVVDEPGQSLEALGSLRRLTADLAEGRPACQECLEPVERALWGLLPAAEAGPGYPRRHRSRLFGAYLEHRR